jgi:hypothetical protein
MTTSDYSQQHDRDQALIEFLRETVARLTDELATALRQLVDAETVPVQRTSVRGGERW